MMNEEYSRGKRIGFLIGKRITSSTIYFTSDEIALEIKLSYTNKTNLSYIYIKSLKSCNKRII